MLSFSKLILVLPVILVFLFDLILTLLCQPSSYWQDYSSCHEGNPVARTVLECGPLYFVGFSVFYAYLVIVLIVKLPKPANIFLTGFVIGTHANASVNWLPKLFGEVLLIEADEARAYCFYLAGIFVVSLVWFSFAFCERRRKKQNPS